MAFQSTAILERSIGEDAQPATNPAIRELVQSLERAFGVEFSILAPQGEHWVHRAADQPISECPVQAELCRQLATHGSPEIIADEEPLAVLALPLVHFEEPYTAVATFVTRSPADDLALKRAAEVIGIKVADLPFWAARQPTWPTAALQRTGALVLEKWAATKRTAALRQEVNDLSIHLATTYEEISLLHRLTQNLKLSAGVEDLGLMTLGWLAEAIPAEALVIQVASRSESDSSQAPEEALWISHGRSPISSSEFSRLLEFLRADPSAHPVVINPPVSRQAQWPFPQIRNLILAPLVEGSNLFGWIAAVNHEYGGEFGSVEASLLSSVGAILGIHSGNIELYRSQAELLASVVRALTSAIDAKDPYTCGHSDRVARVAVRLAAELGCDQQQQQTLYLSGLLHDIGKIGINDNVLRKPGKLTEAEFEHIKTHTDIGYRILRDLRQLGDVLPVVRHHHESWDGGGYPSRLAAFEIPFMARIVAVADAFDAMSSDRPYRPGMPDAKLDEIFRTGAGKQWDAEIIDAFFRARDDIRAISNREREALPPEVAQLT